MEILTLSLSLSLSGRYSRWKSPLCLVGIRGVCATPSPFSVFMRTYQAFFISCSSGGSQCTKSEVRWKIDQICSGPVSGDKYMKYYLPMIYFLHRTFWRRRPVLFPVLAIPCYSELPVLPVDSWIRDYTQHCFQLLQLQQSIIRSLYQHFR